ncbi:MAG: histidine phosphatase family protein [Myxococcales bacterium]|nr:histidine phosphatase family protein [Myxococcales bacterium]
MALIAIRHAPTDAEGLCVGRHEVATKMPHDEAARTIHEGWSGAPPDVVWSSSLSRCLEPARRVAATWHRPHRVDERLLELSYGAWEGRGWDALQHEDGERLRAWMDDWREAAPPGGERVAELEERVRAWWHSLPNGRHLLVAHAGVIRALRVVVDGARWEDAMRAPVPHLQPVHF